MRKYTPSLFIYTAVSRLLRLLWQAPVEHPEQTVGGLVNKQNLLLTPQGIAVQNI